MDQESKRDKSLSATSLEFDSLIQVEYNRHLIHNLSLKEYLDKGVILTRIKRDGAIDINFFY